MQQNSFPSSKARMKAGSAFIVEALEVEALKSEAAAKSSQKRKNRLFC